MSYFILPYFVFYHPCLEVETPFSWYGSSEEMGALMSEGRLLQQLEFEFETKKEQVIWCPLVT